MKTIQHHAGDDDDTLRIVTDGGVIDIQVALVDADGRQVTRVDVSVDDESRGGDRRGRTWRRDGARLVQLLPGEHPEAVNRKAIATAANDLLRLLDEVVPRTVIHWAVEGARAALSSLAFHSKNLHLSYTSAPARSLPTPSDPEATP